MSQHGMTVVNWSPSGVQIWDPSVQKLRAAQSLADCPSGSPVIVAVSQRSSFIRLVPVPRASRDEIERSLPFKLGPLLPIPLAELVYGFRLAKSNRNAVVAAIKSESLTQIQRSAKDANLALKAVVPVAFGSWLAAKAAGLADCAVVEANDDTLTIDIISDGELAYSRSVALPSTQENVDDEVESAFGIAQLPRCPVLVLGGSNLKGDQTDKRHAVEYLSDLSVIQRSLFTFEPSANRVATQEKQVKGAMQRAVAACLLAVVAAGVAYQHRTAQDRDEAAKYEAQRLLLKTALDKQKRAETKHQTFANTRELLQTAFRPSQTMTDIVTSLGAHAPDGIWLTGLTVERGKPLLVRGDSLTAASVAKFVDALAKDPRFRDMKLAFANKGLIGKKQVIQFGITGRAIGNLPLDQLRSEVEPT